MTPYEQGYNDVFEKVAVSPQLVLDAIVRRAVRQGGLMNLGKSTVREATKTAPRSVKHVQQAFGDGGRAKEELGKSLERLILR